ncbi:MAG: diguanylate cyclase [Nitrospirota bacterium]
MTRIVDHIKTSLRLRMTLGMGVMLLPLIILGVGSFVASQSMINALEQVVRTEAEELRPVTELQKLILQAGMPPNDYIILGDRSERVLFGYLVREIDARFKSLSAPAAFGEEKERKFIEAAGAEWEKARIMGMGILAIPHPGGNATAASRMKVFDAHIGHASDILNLLYDEVLHEIDKQRAHARSVQWNETVFLIAVFTGALVVALVAGFLLSRSIILPIRALQDGVFRFGQGDNSFRVVLDRNDEFGRLAKTLNSMAERLEYDGLTGVYNRQEFHRKLKNELDRSLRYGHTCTLLMVDLDHFKQVNDTYGHLCGDDALRAVTMRLLKDVRNFDSVARYGGEELVIIMPETGTAGARAVAERIRESVSTRPITTTRGAILDLTISIGMAAFPADARSEDDLIAAADQALYTAKQQGRNRVVAFEPGMDAVRRKGEP